MNNIIDFLTSKEIIVVYAVAAVASLLYFIISMIDKYSYKRKRKQNTKELNRLVEDVSEKLEEEKELFEEEEIKEEPIVYIEPVIEPIIEEKVITEAIEEPVIIRKEEIEEEKPLSSIEELIVNSKELEQKAEAYKEELNIQEVEELTYTDIIPNQTEAQKELMRLTEELEKASENSQNIDLTAYEEQQEKDAIISLEELIEKSKAMYAANEETQYKDEGNEPISLADLEKKMQEVNAVMIETEENIDELPVIEEIKEEVLEENKKAVLDDFSTIEVKEDKKPIYQEYKSTPIISPVYGIEKASDSNSDIELENTANYEKLDEEIRRTNEFLMTLKELQKNLD